MATFKCKVTDRHGKISEFTREAQSEDILLRELNSSGMFPLSIKAVKEDEIGEDSKVKKYNDKVVLEFTDTIAMLLNSGLSLKDALDVAQDIFDGAQTKELSTMILDKLQKGSTFYSTLREYHASFPPVYRGLVKIGERVGTLDNIFKRLAAYLTDTKKLKENIGGALFYPVMVLSAAFIGIILLIIFVFPKLEEVYQSLGQNIPDDMTSSMEMVTIIFIIVGTIIGLGFVAGIVMAIIRLRGGPGAVTVDRFILRLPLIGPVTLNSEILNFNFAMETLTASDVAIEQALIEASKVLRNKAVIAGILDCREKIMKGELLSRAILADEVFPKKLGRWIGIGERTGKVEAVFSQLRVYYQSEMEKWSTQFMGMLQPVLTLVVGVIVIIMVITFIAPIFTIFSSMI